MLRPAEPKLAFTVVQLCLLRRQLKDGQKASPAAELRAVNGMDAKLQYLIEAPELRGHFYSNETLPSDGPAPFIVAEHPMWWPELTKNLKSLPNQADLSIVGEPVERAAEIGSSGRTNRLIRSRATSFATVWLNPPPGWALPPTPTRRVIGTLSRAR